MAKDAFLNKRGEDGKRLYHWEDAFERIAADNDVQKWELLDALDEVTFSYFYEIRDSLEKSKVPTQHLLCVSTAMFKCAFCS